MLKLRLSGPPVVVLAVLLAFAGVVLAAKPLGGTHYSGSGKLCMNNNAGGKYSCTDTRDKFSLRTSDSGAKVKRFTGHVGPLYCGGGTDTIHDKNVAIDNGAFQDSFSSPNIVGGMQTGTIHVHINGNFKGDGSKVHVAYSFVVHFKGEPKSHDCGARVEGTAHAD